MLTKNYLIFGLVLFCSYSKVTAQTVPGTGSVSTAPGGVPTVNTANSCTFWSTINGTPSVLPSAVKNTGTDAVHLSGCTSCTTAVKDGFIQVTVNDGATDGQYVSVVRTDKLTGGQQNAWPATAYQLKNLTTGGLEDPDVVVGHIGTDYYVFVVGLEASGGGKRVRWHSLKYNPPATNSGSGTLTTSGAGYKTDYLGHSVYCTNPNVDINETGRLVVTWAEISVIERTAVITYYPPNPDGVAQTYSNFQESEGDVMAAYGYVNGNGSAAGTPTVRGVTPAGGLLPAGGLRGDPITKFPIGTAGNSTQYLVKPYFPDVAIADGTGIPDGTDVGIPIEIPDPDDRGKFKYIWSPAPSSVSTDLPICSFVYIIKESNAGGGSSAMVVRQVRWGANLVEEELRGFQQFGGTRPRIAMPRGGSASVTDYEIVQLNGGNTRIDICDPNDIEITPYTIANWGKHSGSLRASGVPFIVNNHGEDMGISMPSPIKNYQSTCSGQGTLLLPHPYQLTELVSFEPVVSFSNAEVSSSDHNQIYSVAWTIKNTEITGSHPQYAYNKKDILSVSLVDGAYYIPGTDLRFNLVNSQPSQVNVGSGNANKYFYGDQSLPSISGRYGYSAMQQGSTTKMTYAWYHNFPEATSTVPCSTNCSSTGTGGYLLSGIVARRGTMLASGENNLRQAVDPQPGSANIAPEPISAFPNPFSSVFKVVSNNTDYSISNISVVDLQGRKIADVKGVKDVTSYDVNLEKYPSGIYILNVNTPKGVHTIKVEKGR